MQRLSLFHGATTVAVLAGGAAAWLALAGNLTTAVFLVGVALVLLAALHFLAERRSRRADQRTLREVRALGSGLETLSGDVRTLTAGLGSLSEEASSQAERARRQAEGAERRLLASIDAARLEAASTRAESSGRT